MPNIPSFVLSALSRFLQRFSLHSPFLKYFGEEKCIVFYIDAPKAVREQRAKDRDPKGFSQDEWDRRVKADNVDFAYDKICRICDFKVDNYNKTIYNLIKEIKDDIRMWKNG